MQRELPLGTAVTPGEVGIWSHMNKTPRSTRKPKLQLQTEIVRKLAEEDLAAIAGGMMPTTTRTTVRTCNSGCY